MTTLKYCNCETLGNSAFENTSMLVPSLSLRKNIALQLSYDGTCRYLILVPRKVEKEIETCLVRSLSYTFRIPARTPSRKDNDCKLPFFAVERPKKLDETLTGTVFGFNYSLRIDLAFWFQPFEIAA